MNFQSNPTTQFYTKITKYSIITLKLQLEDIQISISLMKVLVN